MNNLQTNPEIEIVIADDHPIFRSGLKAIIEAETDLTIIAEADNGETALSVISEYEPDIAVLDLDMPKMNGFEIVRRAQEKNLAVEIIFLTMHDSESIFNTALDLEIKGYVLKDSALPEIIDCIRAVQSGQQYISPPLATLLINRQNRLADGYFENKKPNDLTATERNIMKLIAQNKTNRQIAEELFVSIRTVHRHRENICEKLKLRGVNALLKFAIEHKSEFK